MIPKQQAPHPNLSATENEPLPPLPPLPDGGLAQAMPDWLRPEPPLPSPAAAPVAATDPAGFITEDDLPEWLRQLSPAYPQTAVRVEAPPSQTRVTAPPAPSATLPALSPRLDTAPPRRPEPEAMPRAIQSAGPSPRSSDLRRNIVAVAGVLLLALGVLAYLYATRGGF